MEACSPIVARHTGGATDCEYGLAWSNTYAVRIDYSTTADRAGNAVINRHRAPASRLQRVLEAMPNLRAAAFRQSATEIGVEKLATLATSTTAATTLAGLCFSGLDGIAATARGLLLVANRGMAFVVDTSSAKKFALAHWLVGGVDGGRLFVRVFDGAANVRENIAGDVLASGTTMQWNAPAKGWNAGAVMADASLNRRQTIRVGAGVAFAQVGIVGFDGQIELEALRLFGLPEAAPAVLYACPSVPVGTRSLAAGDDMGPVEPHGRRDGQHRRHRGWRAAGRLRGRLVRHQQHRLRVGLPCVVEQQRARGGAERQRVDGGPRRGAVGGAGDETARALTRTPCDGRTGMPNRASTPRTPHTSRLALWRPAWRAQETARTPASGQPARVGSLARWQIEERIPRTVTT
jgi:hypothetical protein